MIKTEDLTNSEIQNLCDREVELIRKIEELTIPQRMTPDILYEYFEMGPDSVERRKGLFATLSTCADVPNLQLIQISKLLDNHYDPRTLL